MPTIIEGDFATPVGRFAPDRLPVQPFRRRSPGRRRRRYPRRHGVDEKAIDLVRVPGSYEIPLVAHKLAGSGQYASVICLGAVIRGDTDHYDYVAGEAAKGIAQASLATGVPVIFGILTCDTLEQAINRAGAKAGNKGGDAALSAIEMVNLLGRLPGSRSKK